MEIASEMQSAEIELREILAQSPGQALEGIMEAYTLRDATEREALVAVLAGRIVSSEACKLTRLNKTQSRV